MAVTQTTLTSIPNEVTAVVESVESGVGYTYLGCDNGDVWKHTLSDNSLSKLANVGGKVLSLTIYSGSLYIGLAGGKLISLTTS